MADQDEIVGHKTFATGDPLHPFSHEPLTKQEADAILAACDAAKAKRAADMPTEEDAVREMSRAYLRLRELGWRESCYAPLERPLKLIEAGSSGIHEGRCDQGWPNQRFWIAADGDLWPSRPVLFKESPPPTTAAKNPTDRTGNG